MVGLSVSVFACVGEAPDSSGTPTTSQPLGYLAQCDVQADLCDTELELYCFNFNARGPHCTRSCEVDTDCDDPSPGCSGMKVCKVADDGDGGDGNGGGGGDGGGGGGGGA